MLDNFFIFYCHLFYFIFKYLSPKLVLLLVLSSIKKIYMNLHAKLHYLDLYEFDSSDFRSTHQSRNLGTLLYFNIYFFYLSLRNCLHIWSHHKYAFPFKDLSWIFCPYAHAFSNVLRQRYQKYFIQYRLIAERKLTHTLPCFLKKIFLLI